MKRFFLFSLLALLLIMVGACSKPTDESVEPTNTSREEDNAVASSSANAEDKDQSYSHNPSSTEKVEKNQTSTSNESESVSKKQDDHSTTNGEEHPVKDFDVEHYLTEHYPIDHTYYTTDTWENEDTGKTEYIIGIHPDTEEFGQEIDDIFKNGSPEFDDKIKEKRKRLEQPRQANVLRQEKSGFDFYCLRLFDLEGLGAGAGSSISQYLYFPILEQRT